MYLSNDADDAGSAETAECIHKAEARRKRKCGEEDAGGHQHVTGSNNA